MLGLQKGTVKLVPHNTAWEAAFERERKRLRLALGELAAGIEHVGSTAVPDIKAKPVLDIMLGVPARSDFPHCGLVIEQLGYEFRRDPEPDWWFFVKGPEISRTHHLHLCIFESPYWTDHLLFRNHLRAHPEDRRAYESLKLALARDYANDRPVYTEGKSEFILSVLDHAHERNR